MQSPAAPNPYSAPAYDAPTLGSAASIAGPYQSQADRVTLIAVLLGAFCITHVGSMWSCLAANEVVPAVFGFLEPREMDAEGIDALFVASTVSYFICAIAIGMFLHRANKNARALGGESAGMSISPGWTVGWYFVPILNLFKPYLAVKEMWSVSQPTGSDRLPIWWALWIVMSLGGRFLDKYFERAETWEEISRANYLSMGHSLVSIAAAVAVFFVVRGLHEIQQRHCDEGRPLMPGM